MLKRIFCFGGKIQEMYFIAFIMPTMFFQKLLIGRVGSNIF